MLAAALACGDGTTSSSAGDSESSDGESENGDGDGDGDSGDGDGDSGDGDGDGDGDSGNGDGDGDGDSGNGDGDGDGDSGDGDGDSGDGDGDGDSGDGDGDGDGVCDPNAFVGEALADDPWAEGSFCDEIWVCATADQAQMLMNLLDVPCDRISDCPELFCRLSFGGVVTAENVADACTALTVPGIEEVFCVVWGP
jgi:hypothetical protein